MFEVLRDRRDDLYGTVLLDNEIHDALTDDVASLRDAYEPSTWANRLPEIERALNHFFVPVPGTKTPILYVDAQAGRRLIKERCEELGATCDRRMPVGFGYRLTLPTRADAVRLDTQIHLGRSLLDLSVESGHAHAGNAFVRDGYNAEEQRRANAIQRAKQPDDADFVPMESGRFFSVYVPASEPPTVGDPHLYDRINRAMQRHCTSPGVYRGWQTAYDFWCRGDEAFSMPMRSLYLGALELGEERFGRLAKIKDKPTGPALVKLAAFSPSHESVFYDQYFDRERRAQDPRGWGRAEYERACWEGDEAALNAPVFYTLVGTGLCADTARYMFSKVVRKAGIKSGDRYAWIHLGRHDRVEKALAEIHAMDATDAVKEALRLRIAEYIAWAGGKRMLKVYGRRYEALRIATEAVLFQQEHDPARKRSARPAVEEPEDDFFDDVFGDRG